MGEVEDFQPKIAKLQREKQEAHDVILGLQKEKEENTRMRTDQALGDYLASIHRVTFHMKRFAELGNEPLFPSVLNVDHLSDSLMEELPSELLGSEAFLNEAKTSYFLHETLQKPTERILNAYLRAIKCPKKLYFDNRTVGWRPPPSDLANAVEGADAAPAAVPARPPPKTQPDCLVLCADILTSAAELEAAAEAEQAEPQDANAIAMVQEDAVRQAERGPPGQVLFARALTQAFHYMVVSGLEYGYMATGETLSLLRVPKDDRTHSCTTATRLLEFESQPEPVRQRSINISQLTRFPNAPETIAPQPTSRQSSRKRRNDDDYDGRGSDDGNGNDSAVGDMCSQKRYYKRQRACLLGLMRGSELDAKCPSLILHRQALQRDGTDLRTRPTAHAITATELHELIRLQLLANAEQDFHCFLEQGLSGAIGCLFTITITGYDYTFSAKDIEEHFSGRLRREVRVYDVLAPQQGSSLPVCLGLVELLLPWPMANGALVTHMLLMSYAGRPLYRVARALRDRVDREHETQRTLDELARAGFLSIVPVGRPATSPLYCLS